MILVNGWTILKCLGEVNEKTEWLNILRERKYRTSDINMSYRQINSLESSNVIPATRRNKKEWRAFNLMELLHLRILLECRKFGVKNKQIESLLTTLYSETVEWPTYKQKLSGGEVGVLAAMASIRISLVIMANGTTTIVDTEGLSRLLGKKKPEPISYLVLNLNELLLKTTKPEVMFARNIGKYSNLFIAMEDAISAPNKTEKFILEKFRDNRYRLLTIKKGGGKTTLSVKERLQKQEVNKKMLGRGNVEIKINQTDNTIVNIDKTETFRLPSEPN